jgi:metal-responsive CopG/Arc/MetJ family transcriptional regulator
VVVRLQDDMLRSLDRWMIKHDLLSRPEAIRQILKEVVGNHKP